VRPCGPVTVFEAVHVPPEQLRCAYHVVTPPRGPTNVPLRMRASAAPANAVNAIMAVAAAMRTDFFMVALRR